MPPTLARLATDPARGYDLRPNVVHTYYVQATGPGATTTGPAVLVHNCGEGPPGVPASESWGKPSSLTDHFDRHGPDFGSGSEEEYAQQASSFFQRGLREQLPTKVDGKGTIRIYEPETNSFGSYNANGTTKTDVLQARSSVSRVPDQRGLLERSARWFTLG